MRVHRADDDHGLLYSSSSHFDCSLLCMMPLSSAHTPECVYDAIRGFNGVVMLHSLH